jgi:bifunctional non-homologous end joining protein LigD
VRAAVAVAGGRARVVGRHGRDETARYPEAEGIPARLRVESAILDCEIVVLDERGRPDFGRLQSRLNIDRPGDVRRAVERCPATFIAFDLLRVGERDLMDTDLRIRKKTLRDILEPGGPLLFADHVDTEGERLFDAVREQGLEGIVAKRGDSRYQPGKRSPDWLKIKSWHSQSCTIAGWVEGRGRRGSLGSLLLAVHGADGWVACGHVGAGVGDADIARLLARLRSIRRSTSVVNNPPATEGVTWVEPELVCEIRHAGWTRGGALRHPVFLGLRADLAPEECVREKATGADPAGAAVPAAEGGATAPAGGREPSASARPQLDAEVAEALEDLPRLRPDDVWTIGPRRLRLTNLDKPLWPDPVITKRQMIDYYVRMSPYLLPYLRGRPLSMQVFPDGITGHSFWRKDKPAHAPEWIDSWLFQGEGGSKTWIVVNEPATLAWLANAGVVDLHPWHSRTDDPLRPDWAVFDLDPSEPATFEDVRDIARLVKAALDHLGMRGVLKTSGQTGLQIYVPLRRGPDYARVRGWVLEVARAIGRVEPDRITWEWSVSRRAGRIRIDYTQNIVNKTLAAPYSLRPGPGAPVSTPLTWDELEDPHLRSDAWTMATIWDRLRDVGDLFGDVLSGDQDLPGERGVPGG